MKKYLYTLITILVLLSCRLSAQPLPKGFDAISLGTSWDRFIEQHPQAKDTSWRMSLDQNVSSDSRPKPGKKAGFLTESFRGMEFFDRGEFAFSDAKLMGINFSNLDTKAPVNREAYLTMLIRLYGKPDASGIFNKPMRDSVFLMWNLPEGRVLGISPLTGKNGSTILNIVSSELLQRSQKVNNDLASIKTEPQTPEEKADIDAVNDIISNFGSQKKSSPSPDSSTPIPDRTKPEINPHATTKTLPPVTPSNLIESQKPFFIPLIAGILFIIVIAGFILYRNKH